MAAFVPCGPCGHECINKNAEKWCTECNEGFCNVCEKAHTSMKMSRDHNLIPIDDYRKIENVKVRLVCQEHGSKLEMYCKIHEMAICITCFPAEHKGCSEAIIPLAEAAKNAKTSTALADLEHTIHDIIENIQECVREQEAATESIEIQETKIKKIIFDTREGINKHLDQLERKMLNELATTINSCRSTYGKLKNQLEQTEREIKQTQTQTSQLKCFASDLQMFLSTHQMNEEVQDQVHSLKDAISSVQNFNIEIELHQEITSLLKDVNSFGKIKVVENATSFKFQEGKIDQAQIQLPEKRSIHNTKLQLRKRFTVKQSGKDMYISGCSFLPNGNLLIADMDGQNVLMEYNEEGHFIRDITVSAKPFDLTVIDSFHIAVSYFDLYYIEFIDLKNIKVLKKIKFKNRCQGISYSDGKIFVAVIKKGIVTLDMEGTILNTIKSGLKVTNITTCKNKIYYVQRKQDTVNCCSTSGEDFWSFEDGSLNPAGGIAADRYQNVFVVGIESNKILMLQNNGKLSKTILTMADGLLEPTRICLNKERNILLVCNKRNGIAFLFNVY